MAPFGKIYSYAGNFRVQRAQVVAAINGLDVQPAEDFTMMVTNRTPEFLSKFPMGKVPALECANGFCISEGAAICTYLAESGPAAEQLTGRAGGPGVSARVTEWSFFAENELVANVMPMASMSLFKVIPFDKDRHASYLAAFKRALERVESAVRDGKQCLVGEQLTLADVMVSGPLFFALGSLFDAELRKEVPETVRYLQGLLKLPEFQIFNSSGIDKA